MVKAHIIPEAFFRAIGAGRDTPLLISNDKDHCFPQRQPIGVYDQGILCEACERKFERVDDYGVKVLLRQFPVELEPMNRMGDLVGFKGVGVDQDLLLRFFVAALWRASLSTHLFYRRVTLGAHYERLARQSISDRPLTQAFGVILSRWSYSERTKSLVTGLMEPFRERWSGVNAYRFYFGEFVAYIKVDRRPFPPDLALFALTSASEVRVANRNFDRSKDFAAMKKTAIGQAINSSRFQG